MGKTSNNYYLLMKFSVFRDPQNTCYGNEPVLNTTVFIRIIFVQNETEK